MIKYVSERFYRQAEAVGWDMTEFQVTQDLPLTPEQELDHYVVKANWKRHEKPEVGRPTEDQSDVPAPFPPETNGNL